MIFWITGRAGSGKTTLAKKIAEQIDGVVLDGDEVRRENPDDFSPEGRERNQRRIVAMALELWEHGVNVVIACVSPDKALRRDLQSCLPECIEIQMPFGTLWNGTQYEE